MCAKVNLKPFIVCVSVIFSPTLVWGFTAGPEPDLVGWWTLDEGMGSVAHDYSGNGNTGTIHGTPIWTDGKINGALQLNGINCYIDCGNGPSLQITSQITMACWLRTPGFTRNWAAIITKGDTAWRLSRSSETGNSIHMGINGTVTAGMPWFDAGTPVTDNQWHHIAGVYDGKEARIYIDGVVSARYAASGRITSNANNVFIGENQGAAGRFFTGILDDVRIYRRGLGDEEIQVVMMGYHGPLASEPQPKDRTVDVPRDVILSWTAGPYALTHDVYLGTDPQAVETASRADPKGVLVSQGQAGTSYESPALLDFEKVYYWRVDEVNAPPDLTIYKGLVWSFTTEPYAYPVRPVNATASSISTPAMGPEKTIDNSGLDDSDGHSTSSSAMWLSKTGSWPAWIKYEFDRPYKFYRMWVWNQNQAMEPYMGYSAKDVTVELSLDDEHWTSLTDVPQFAQGTGKVGYQHNTEVDMKGVLARYVRLTITTSWSGRQQAGLSEVRFFYIPLQAFGPIPSDGAVDVDPGGVLYWRPGREAARHQLYLGSSREGVSGQTVPVISLAKNRLPMAQLGLEYGRTYYWKVNGLSDAVPPTIWEGQTWTFTTIGYAVVDDFESYDDRCNRIFFAWIDGFGHSGAPACGVAASGGNGTNSTVGNLTQPFAEQLIVRSGRQSMPFGYDNTRWPFYSEAVREFSSAQSWRRPGIDTLTVYLQGVPAAFVEVSPGNIIMNGAGNNIGGFTDQFRFVYRTLSGNGSIVARVDGIGDTHPAAKAAVMIRESLEPGSTYAMVVITPASGIGLEWRATTGQNAQALTQARLGAPYWVKLTRQADAFTARISADGVNWVPVNADTTGSTVTIKMAKDVYLGLAVTSRLADRACGARFSQVVTTGTVGGAWQVAEIGAVAQFQGNMPELFYVAVEDAGGRQKVLVHPDPTMIVTGLWERWDIALSQLSSAGVDLGSVKKLILGVGNRASPVPGGRGTIYIDDIRLTRQGY